MFEQAVEVFGVFVVHQHIDDLVAVGLERAQQFHVAKMGGDDERAFAIVGAKMLMPLQHQFVFGHIA